MTTAHLFGYGQGQEVMEELFNSELKGEFFLSKKGMLLSDDVEARFDKGMLVIVPCQILGDIIGITNLGFWHDLELKEYMVKVVDYNSKLMMARVQWDEDLTWVNLDGSKLQFLDSFRLGPIIFTFDMCVQF